MNNPFDRLGNPNIGGNFQNSLLQGMELGTQMRERREQKEKEKALDDFYRAKMGGDPNAVTSATANLSLRAPKLAYEFKKGDDEARIRADVVAGRAPASAMAGFDFEGYLKLDKAQQDIYKNNIDVIGNMALAANTPQAWDEQVRLLGPEFAQYVGRFDLRQSVIAKAKMTKDYIEQNEPKYQVVPQGGMLVNTKDPRALQQAAQQGTQPKVDVSKIPQTAIQELKSGVGSAEQFDLIFGAGAAQEVLGGGAASNGGGNFPGWF